MIATDSLLDFVLPPELEAHEPPEARGLGRDEVRLMVSYRSDDRIVHARFSDLPDFLRAGDLLVANDSATLPAALSARRADRTPVALHLSTRIAGSLWVVEPRKVEVAPGEALVLPGEGRAVLLAPYAGSSRLWLAQIEVPEPMLDYLRRWGRPVAYSYVPAAWPIETYQTIFAREPGSAEMPSAGRPFSERVLERLGWSGIRVETITLHTGVSSLESPEPPYSEAYSVSGRAADAVNETRRRGGRIVAVGTTVIRALESAADESGWVVASKGWTDLVVTPERGVRAVDALLTGFHEPRASHLAMLEALAGRRHLAAAYREALEARYLWHEFGDVHLILP